MTAFVVLDNREIVVTFIGARVPTHYLNNYIIILTSSCTNTYQIANNNYATATKTQNAQ